MRKIFTLLILLMMLPVTALAAAPDRQVIYVGNENVTSGGYWTTDSNGSVTAYTEDGTTPSNNYIHYNKETNTLTLHNATIKESLDYTDSNGDSSFIHSSAIGVLNQQGNAELTIQLEGSNTIAGVGKGIYVLAHSQSTGSSRLTIMGNGSLDTSSRQTGIWVQSNSNNAALSIENAKVTATVVDGYGGNGVFVQSSENSSVSLTVNSGSLTATGRYAYDAGILLQFGSGGSGSGSGTPTVTVSGNAVVDAKNGGIANNSSSPIQYKTGSDSTGGIVFDVNTGTVYGKVELQEDLEIGEGESLTIGDGASLNTGSHEVIVDGGTLNGADKITGTVKYAPTITTQPTSQTVTEGGTATFTVVTSGTEPLSYQWQQSTDNGNSWTNIDSANAAEYATGQTTTSMNGYQYRCMVSNSVGSVESNAATLTVNAKPTYTITAESSPAEGGTVSGSGSYTEGTSVTLTATVNSGYRFVGWMENGQQVSADATYTFTANSNHTLTAKFEQVYTVTVSPVEGGTATADKTTAAAGETITLTAEASKDYRFTGWTSSNEGVTFAEASSVSTTFTMPAGDVIVTAGFEQYYPVNSITLDKSELSLYTDESETLTATIEPDNATNQTVIWSSDKPEVAMVDDDGKVTAMAAGKATITAMADGGKTATCVVQVREYVEVEASGSTNLSFTTDRDKFTLTAVVKAEGNVLTPTENSWKWSVANEDVVERVTLRSKAVSYSTSRQAFTIKGTGTTTITATYDDGTYRGSVEFKVSISKPTPPDPISYYNIYVEDVCDGVEVSTSKQVVREGGSVSVYVKKDTVNYTFDNFKVYYKRSYYGGWEELKEGTQPGEYPIKNIWTHIYIKAEGAEEKEDPTGIESIEGVKVYTKDGSLYVQTPQREQVIIVSMSGAVVKNEEQVGLKQYHGLQPGIYIVRVGDRAYKLRLN